jgi:hypothetical protein
MAKVKQTSQLQRIKMDFSGGLNLAMSDWSIADNESPRMLNWLYNPESLLPEIRPGTTCQTDAAAASPIRALYLYEKTASVKYVVAAIGAKLYYLSGATLNAWTEIGAIASATTVPDFCTYNSLLYIADGGSLLKTWDGTTYGTVTGSPNASCMAIIKQRLACNPVGEADSVYLSAPNDASATGWNTATTAIGLKAGYGDTLAVNDLETFGDDLIVSKKGKAEKKVYRINTEDPTTSNWYVEQIPGKTCAQTIGGLLTAFNNVYIFDDNGIRSLKGVQEYGDIQADQTGKNINSEFANDTLRFLKYVPYYHAVWIGVGDRTFTMRIIDNIPAFTELYFNQGNIYALCCDENTIYLGGYNGYLYKIDETKDTDETAPDTESGYASYLKSKRHNIGADDFTLMRTALRATSISAGTMYLHCISHEADTTIDTITLYDEGDKLYDATGYLNAATDYIYSPGVEGMLYVNHNKIKSSAIQFEIQATGARCSIDAIIADVMITKGTW